MPDPADPVVHAEPVIPAFESHQKFLPRTSRFSRNLLSTFLDNLYVHYNRRPPNLPTISAIDLNLKMPRIPTVLTSQTILHLRDQLQVITAQVNSLNTKLAAFNLPTTPVPFPNIRQDFLGVMKTYHISIRSPNSFSLYLPAYRLNGVTLGPYLVSLTIPSNRTWSLAVNATLTLCDPSHQSANDHIWTNTRSSTISDNTSTCWGTAEHFFGPAMQRADFFTAFDAILAIFNPANYVPNDGYIRISAWHIPGPLGVYSDPSDPFIAPTPIDPFPLPNSIHWAFVNGGLPQLKQSTSFAPRPIPPIPFTSFIPRRFPSIPVPSLRPITFPTSPAPPLIGTFECLSCGAFCPNTQHGRDPHHCASCLPPLPSHPLPTGTHLAHIMNRTTCTHCGQPVRSGDTIRYVTSGTIRCARCPRPSGIVTEYTRP